MRVAIDGTPLDVTSGGLRRYTEELTRALSRAFAEDQFLVVPPRRGRWWSLGLPWELARMGADLFHGTNFAVPYLPLRPSVLTLHDLSLWMEPGWHPGPNRERRRAPVLLGLGLAGMVITPTETVRREAIERFRLHPSRVVAIPEGTNLGKVAAPRSDSYFLYVGTIEPRKNLPLLIESWREIRRQYAVDLVLAGRRRHDGPAIKPEPGLRMLGEVPDRELPALYSGALAFCYPSQYEGFGLPVLEAMACGACVLTSKDPAIEEVAGDAAVRLDADPRAWVEALRSAVERPEWVTLLRQRALSRAAGFTWERTARLTREVYAEAIRRF